MYVAVYSTWCLPDTAETYNRWQMNVYCSKTFVGTEINTDVVYALFALYDLVLEMLWLLEYSFREITGRSPVELLFPSFLSVLLTKYSRDQIKKNEMGGACGTYGRQERCVQAFGGDILGKE
jgi:hypothetical protein